MNYFPLPLPLFTPSLNNFITDPLCFLTAYKSCDLLPDLARTSDSKNPDPYYYVLRAECILNFFEKIRNKKAYLYLFFMKTYVMKT